MKRGILFSGRVSAVVFLVLGGGGKQEERPEAVVQATSDYNTQVYDPDDPSACTHENVKELLVLPGDFEAVWVRNAEKKLARRDGRDVVEITAKGVFQFGFRKRDIDLSTHSAVSMELTNTGSGALALDGQMKGSGKGKSKGALWLAPGETELLIFASLLRAESIPPHLLEYFKEAKNAGPGYFICPYKYQESPLKDSVSLSISSYDGIDAPMKFTVNRIWAGGRREELPPLKLAELYPRPYLDDFGQWRFQDWPGKVKSESDFEARVAAEARDVEACPEPLRLSRYWGWADGPKLKATGRFRVEKYRDRWWFVDPEGYLFLSQAFLQTWAGRREDELVRKLRSWGATSVGGRSGHFGGHGIPYCLHLDRNAPVDNLKMHETDLEEETYRAKVRARIEKSLKTVKDDPWCIGVFINNEISFLNDRSAHVYFKINAQEIRRFAPGMLYLGAKSHAATEIAAQYCDVVSVDVLSKTTTPLGMSFYSELDKPILMGAFSCGYVGDGMFSGPGVIHGNTRLQGRAYELYCKVGYTNPNAVGFHLYTLRDNVTWGGGILRRHGLWNKSLVAGLRRLSRSMYPIHMGTVSVIDSLK